MGENISEVGPIEPTAADVLDRRRPVWVVPDTVPAIVPRSAWVTEPPWVAVYRWAAIGGDLLAAVIGASVALLTRFGYTVGAGYLIFGSLLPLAWVAAVALARGYESRSFGAGADEFRSILRSGVGLTAVVAIASYATKSEIARGFVVLAIPATVMLALLLRYFLRRDLSRHRYRGRCMRRVLVVGRNGEASTLSERLEKRPADGYRVVAICRPRGDSRPGGTPADALDEADIMAAVNRHTVDVVAVAADPDLAGQSLRRLSWALEQHGVELIVSPGIIEVAGPRISVRPVAGLSLLHLERPSASAGPHLLKSIFDRVAALILLIIALPLLAGIFLSVKLSSRGPAMFKQQRVGRGNVVFTMLKFRTMVVGSEAQQADLEAQSEGNTILFKLRVDPRVTKIGAYLRRYSLDELPQLINVMHGKMSLVGPRPPLPEEVALYHDDVRRRLLVKPGLTGLWQISGRSDLDWDDSVRLDLRYVENWSFTLDLMILWKTMSAVVRGRGAY